TLTTRWRSMASTEPNWRSTQGRISCGTTSSPVADVMSNRCSTRRRAGAGSRATRSGRPAMPTQLLDGKDGRFGLVQLDGPAIDLDVLLRRMAPREIAPHVALHDAAPDGRLFIRLEGAHDGREQVHAVIALEGEAIALTGAHVEVLHRVGQAAGVAHDGHAAVAHGDHLAQPARLKFGRHQEHVAP